MINRLPDQYITFELYYFALKFTEDSRKPRQANGLNDGFSVCSHKGWAKNNAINGNASP